METLLKITPAEIASHIISNKLQLLGKLSRDYEFTFNEHTEVFVEWYRMRRWNYYIVNYQNKTIRRGRIMETKSKRILIFNPDFEAINY